MRPIAGVIAALILAPVALSQEPGSAVPSLPGQIAVSKPMTPAQKIATLEEALNKETDRRADLDAKVVALAQENNRLASARDVLARDKASTDTELARTRDAMALLQRDFESLRGDYTRIAKSLRLSLETLAPLALLIFALLGWLLYITRRLAVHVHDVPTMAKMHEYETLVAHLHDQLKAEKGHNAVLKDRLAHLGIVD
ncbi:MAG: hypothetical protein ABSF35_06370 [Polyangia bacterium]|jgi:hypothetical protein